jgi:hypothetical protein
MVPRRAVTDETKEVHAGGGEQILSTFGHKKTGPCGCPRRRTGCTVVSAP